MSKFSKVQVSKKLNASIMKVAIVQLVVGILGNAFSFCVQGAKMAISANCALLGIVFIFLYFLEKPVKSAISSYSTNLAFEFSLKLSNEVTTNAMEILSYVRTKVYLEEEGRSKKMSDGTILRYLVSYMESYIKMKVSVAQNACNILTTGFMMLASIKVALIEMPNKALVISFMTFLTIAYIAVAVRNINRAKQMYKKIKLFNERTERSKDDVINVVPLSKSHIEYMADNFKKSSVDSILCKKEVRYKNNIEKLILSMLVSTTILVIVLLKISYIGIENFNVSSVLEIIAFASIYSATISEISTTVSKIEEYVDIKNGTLAYRKDYDSIYKTYTREKSKKIEDVQLESIIIYPFEFGYYGNMEKYTLKLDSTLVLARGDIVVLNGKTGSGKSTFMDIISRNLVQEKSKVLFNGEDIFVPYQKHDTSSRLGSGNILSEITFNKEVDHEKLEYLLRGLTIFDDIAAKYGTNDIMAIESKLSNAFECEFSEGQKQRFILTRFLYGLPNNVKLILLDEPTLKLDSITTTKVMKFMLDYLGKDRIVIVSTHSILETVELSNRMLTFKKGEEGTYSICE